MCTGWVAWMSGKWWTDWCRKYPVRMACDKVPCGRLMSKLSLSKIKPVNMAWMEYFYFLINRRQRLELHGIYSDRYNITCWFYFCIFYSVMMRVKFVKMVLTSLCFADDCKLYRYCICFWWHCIVTGRFKLFKMFGFMSGWVLSYHV